VSTSFEALVIGAGPAGLATSRALSERGVAHVVLERGTQVGATWAALYDSLVLHTAKELSALPGLRFPRSTPRFPSRGDVLAYLHQYAEQFRAPVRTGTAVVSLRRATHAWIATAATGETIEARAVVMATGIVANPQVPAFPRRGEFAGTVVHSSDYRRPDAFIGRRVLVVGAGNSAGEIAAELAHAGAEVTIGVRSGATVLPLELAGIPIQYFGVMLGALPASVQRVMTALPAKLAVLTRNRAMLPPPAPARCPNVPLIGLHLVEGLRAGRIQLRGAMREFTPRGVRFHDDSEEPFDAVILATGYSAALNMLPDAVRRDDCGFGLRRDRIVSVDQPGLYFVGHTYDMRGALFNMGRDSRLAARHIANT
jgi:thioredoxin reductase